jgi:hypothetical protein
VTWTEFLRFASILISLAVLFPLSISNTLTQNQKRRNLISHHKINQIIIMMHAVDSPVTDHQNDAFTQRSLDPQDRVCFDDCFASLSSIVLFPLTGVFGVTRSDSKLKMAFKQVVENTPISQTQVVGKGDNAVFRKLTDDDALPSMTIEPHVEKSKTAMMNRARSILSDQKAEMAAGRQDALRLSVRLHAVRGPQDIALAFSTPHHFADGTGTTSILAQLCMTQLLPKCCWGLSRVPEEQMQLPPSFMEMALESEFASNCDAFRKADVLRDTFLSKMYAEDTFRIQNYDLAAPDALSKLRGLDEHLVRASAKSLKRCCRELRKKGVSLTSAFSALAIKLLVKLIAECSDDNGATATGSCLLAANPIDARAPGKWDDKDKRKLQSKRFPIVGNHAFANATQIQFDAVLASPLEEKP